MCGVNSVHWPVDIPQKSCTSPCGVKGFYLLLYLIALRTKSRSPLGTLIAVVADFHATIVYVTLLLSKHTLYSKTPVRVL